MHEKGVTSAIRDVAGQGGARGLRLWWVDVFATREPLSGNRLMVFVPAADVIEDEGRMRRIAREVGFSEVSFLVPEGRGSAYRARFFTPERELPYAGHPTLGSAAVWCQETAPMADRSHVVQHTPGATVEVSVLRDGANTIAEVQAPGITRGGDPDPGFICEVMGLADTKRLATGPLAPCIVTAPVPQAFVCVKREVLATLRPEASALRRAGERLGVNLIYVYALPDTVEEPIEARGFVCDLGFAEDPATGSAAGSLGHLLAQANRLEDTRTCTVLQGRAVGRESEIWLSRAGNSIRVAGRVRFVSRGRLLPEFLA